MGGAVCGGRGGSWAQGTANPDGDSDAARVKGLELSGLEQKGRGSLEPM